MGGINELQYEMWPHVCKPKMTFTESHDPALTHTHTRAHNV